MTKCAFTFLMTEKDKAVESVLKTDGLRAFIPTIKDN